MGKSGPVVSRDRAIQLGLEGLMVLLGVSIALLADEWREERQLQQEANAARTLLEAEVISNYELLVDFQHDVSDRYQRFRPLLDVVDGSRPFDDYQACFIGYRFTQFRDAAWVRASRDRIGSRLDAEFMSAVAGLYSWNETLNELQQDVREILYSKASFDPADAPFTARIAERIIWQQRRWGEVMVEAYNEFAEDHLAEKLENLQRIDEQAAEAWVAAVEKRNADQAGWAGYDRCKG